MNDDERLSSILGELHGANPDAGFEQRVLSGVAARQAPEKPQRRLFRLLAPAAGLVCAGVLLLAVVRHAGPRPVAAGTPAVARLEPTPRVSPRRSLRAVRVRTPLAANPAEDARVMASFPAPPLPLTEQEKQLRRIAHTGDPQEFATLNAEARARVAADKREAYQAYFAPPPPSQDVLDTIKLQKKGDL